MTTKFMTTIDSRYTVFLKSYSKKYQITQRSIIEKALDVYIKQQQDKSLDEQYAKMWTDKDYLKELSENAESYLSYL